MMKIVMTGGPGAGKTEIMSHLTQNLEERGYKVFIIPETATELILGGIAPGKHISMEEFQSFVLEKQLAKEALYQRAAAFYDPEKVLIFCDRGIMDSCAYVEKPVFERMLRKQGLTLAEAYQRYDAALHLVTAADGAEAFYQWNDPSKEEVGNNAARSESPAQAREKDKLTMQAWIGHSHLRVFDNSTDFAGKIRRVIEEVFALLGEPIPMEIERKFLIRRPTPETIAALGCVSETQIIQTYLYSRTDGTERRVRQRGTAVDGYTFYYTEKTELRSGTRMEKEEKISQAAYIQYLTEADTSLHQIAKTRYCFIYENRYFEMDLYPFSEDYAILEIELHNRNEAITLPPLEVVQEVTDDKRFRNAALAKCPVLAP